MSTIEPELREIVALGMPVQYDVWITYNCPWIRLRSYTEALKSADRMIKFLEDHGYKIVLCDSHTRESDESYSNGGSHVR